MNALRDRDFSEEWIRDCIRWRGVVLTGRYGHWCFDYDELPVDETCPEWPCGCAEAQGFLAGDPTA